MPTVHFKEILPFSSVIFELRDVFSLDYFDLISADCLIRVNLWTGFYVIVFAPVLLIVIIQARAKLQWCGWKRRKADTDTAIRHISTVAIAQGNLTISVQETPQVSQPAPFSQGQTTVVPQSDVTVEEELGREIRLVNGATSLSTLVNGLNALGVSPRDMISILQAIKAAGALQAEIEVL